MPVEAKLDCDVESRGEATVFWLRGTLDRDRAAELRVTLEKLQRQEPPRLALDMSGATYIDSAIVAVLVEAMQRALHGAGFIVMSGVHGPVRSLIEMTKLDQTVFTIASTLEDALAMPNVRRTRRVVPTGLTCDHGDVCDVSTGGLRLRAPERLDGVLDLVLTVARRRFQLRGAVAWSSPVDGGFAIGVRFVDPDASVLTQLADALGPCRPMLGSG